DGKSAQINNIDFDIDEVTNDWICRKKYNFNKITSKDDVNVLIQKIEDEIFDETNTKSLVSRIKSYVILN
ncbi:MAG TPA: hypothetical protein DCL77_20800, partial [Prolixibacteraceae bacterium]|nr:hypothetical protein [Prolixibacteraceae bacterium]